MEEFTEVGPWVSVPIKLNQIVWLELSLELELDGGAVPDRVREADSKESQSGRPEALYDTADISDVKVSIGSW